MRKLVVFEWMSLDGVVQAPAYADEDTSGGFKHGGWHLRYFEERSMKWVVENVTGAGGFLLGRESRRDRVSGPRAGRRAHPVPVSLFRLDQQPV